MASERMTLIALELAEANAFVSAHHRHHRATVGHKFSLGAALNESVIGIAIIGRPVARGRDDGETLEVTRLCTDGVKYPTGRMNRSGAATFHNPCSFLYGAAARACFALGYARIGTYILATEPGTSLTAAGWRQIAEVQGRSWTCQSRPRVDKHPTQDKLLFEAASP